MRSKLFYDFCNQLLDYLNNDYNLQEALEYLSQGKTVKRKLREFCSYLLLELKKGSLFSAVLLANPYLKLPEKYKALFYSEEKTGNFKKTLSYVCKTEKEKIDSYQELIKLSIYPSIIIILCVVGSFVFSNFSTSFPTTNKVSVFDGLLYANGFLLLFILSFSFLLYLAQRKSEKNILLICLDFFLGNSYDLITSLEYASVLFEANSKLREKIFHSISDLKLGLPLALVFFESTLFSKVEIEILERHIQIGNIRDGFQAILSKIEKKSETIRQIAKALVEPSLILCAGTYFFIIVVHTILPYFLFYGDIL